MSAPEPDYCGCCGRELGTPGAPRCVSEAFFCQPCALHLAPKAYHPWDRTFEAQFERSCPYTVTKEIET